ncbi:LpqN/LpqT family lipoprotein [Nocardia farcinica]|uniref:LpqN/LpqT family lipoprotein n=1 Tax=Nocardia farcinica TaxID=37329 RepID=UPI002456BE56|nr:LpqN/LpqT family lipoprotein [Nocardia farcinica]
MNESIAEYLYNRSVRCIPVHADTIGAPQVWLDLPVEWVPIGREVMPGAYLAWVHTPTGQENAQWLDNIVIMVGRLTGRIDTWDLMDRAFVDSRRLPSWSEHSNGYLDCSGYRSAVISGSYVGDGLRVHATTQYLVVRGEEFDYFVQYTMTVSSDSPLRPLVELPPSLIVEPRA